MNTITIKPATERDFTDWAHMRCALWPHTSMDEHEQEILEFFQQDGFAVFIASDAGGTARGFIEVSLRPYVNGCKSRPAPFIEGVWVDESLRRQNVGQKLVETVEQWAQKKKHVEIGSDALLENTESIAAHKKWGFVETEKVVYFRKPIRAKPIHA